jgi:dTDP-4-amino-4,6-dideoxygalactose transaminase
VSDKIWKKILTMPLYPDLKPEQLEFIINSVREFFN